MRRIFLVSLLVVMAVMAKAQVSVEDYYLDYTKNGFSFYNMGFTPTCDGDGWHFTAPPAYKEVEVTEENENDPEYEGCEIITKTEGEGEDQVEKQYFKVPDGIAWYQFFAGDGVPTVSGARYTITVMVKGDRESNIHVNFGDWGKANGGDLHVTTEWTAQTVEIEAPTNSCFIVFQPGANSTNFDMKWLSVSHTDDSINPELLCMKISGLTQKSNTWDQTVDYEIGTLPAGKYSISFEVYGDADDTSTTVLTNGEWTWEWRIPSLDIKKGEWNKITKQLDINVPFTKLSFFIGTYAGSAIYLDNFEIKAEGSDVNLAPNGDFSLASNRGWSKPSWHPFSLEVAEGPSHGTEANPEPETNWVNLLENGDASGEYGEPACAQNKEQGGEVQPCPITDGVFVAHAKAKVDAEWDNQFWIVSPKACSTGQKMRISFRYKADKNAEVSTQTHKAPSQYLHWDCIGTLNFTNEWQEFSREITVAENMNRMQSIAFNLSKFEEENNYYFDDLKWEYDADQEWVEPLPEWTVPAGEIDLTTIPFSGDCANNIGKRIDASTPIYGNQSNGDDNVDLTDYECVKIYGNPGLALRIFVNRSGGEGVTGGKTEQNLTINETGVAVLDIAAVMDATESDHCYLSCIKSGWGDPGKGYVLGITTIKILKPEVYSRSTTAGNFGTIALRYSASVEGATLYEVESFDAASGLVLSEVDGNMVKGTPYIFVANADAITCTQLDVNEAQATGDWTADGAGNGLVGLYVNWPYGTETIRGCYVISGNKLRKIGEDATNVTVAANRCFFDLKKYKGPKTSEAPKVRIPLEDETNGISDALTEKSLNDGKIYDLNGREVKSMQKGGVYIMGGMKVMVK